MILTEFVECVCEIQNIILEFILELRKLFIRILYMVSKRWLVN